MKTKKELQKFKEDPTEGRIDNLLVRIINGRKLRKEDVYHLTDKQKKKVAEVLTGGLLALKDKDRDTFLETIEDVLSEESRRELWERNHTVIIACIDYLMRQKNRMPTPTEISDCSGLSRQTVYNHLKAYHGSKNQKEKQQTISILREKMVAKVYVLGMEGDVRAAKVFLDATEPKENNRITNQQNNFIQLNGTTITHEQIKALPEDQQSTLIEIIQNVTQLSKTSLSSAGS